MVGIASVAVWEQARHGGAIGALACFVAGVACTRLGLLTGRGSR